MGPLNFLVPEYKNNPEKSNDNCEMMPAINS
jgi:hypothetical protein